VKLLAFETSCDETSAAVVVDGEVRSNVVATQAALHREYGGVVPELAVREHLKNLPWVTQTALKESGLAPRDLDAVAATCGPGLPGALLVGLKAAQGMAQALELPFLGIHHHEAHLYSCWITGQPPRARWDDFRPNVGLIVSGGHTLLILARAELEHRVLGGTLDDAAGECFDKAAKLLGLPYPGGPALDQLAREGNPRAFDLPRPKLADADDDFSFSGLKTAVRYLIRDHPELTAAPDSLRDLCASVEAAIVEVLVAKTLRAAIRERVACVTASGGVTSNSGLRLELAAACQRAGLELRLAESAFCTDNAGMIATLAERLLERGCPADDLDLEPRPGWEMPERSGSPIPAAMNQHEPQT
jgi:N6-L-threonylcarbamoyladenine synthase